MARLPFEKSSGALVDHGAIQITKESASSFYCAVISQSTLRDRFAGIAESWCTLG